MVEAGGPWILRNLVRLDADCEALLEALPRGAAGSAELVLDRLGGLDTAGAWRLHQLELGLIDRGYEVTWSGLDDARGLLVAEVRRVHAERAVDAPTANPWLRMIADLGEGTIQALDEGRHLLAFYGACLVTLGRVLRDPRRLRMTSLMHHLEHTCVRALPIVGLISFLIGIVLAYQGAEQLRWFGAEIYTINLLGVSVLREIGILLTAIVVAGRSGSAFTAQIGTMKINQEVDALRTMGLDPIEILVLPRIIALVIALPLLAFFADLMGLAGGGVMVVLALGIPPPQFLNQLDWAITPAMFVVGMVKAPVFAFLIAMVGCYQGLRVSGSAESVGALTTRSVVVGIFLVIVTDALFSIVFSILGV
jgi:phospholipid/cholesterol/gamma-HCH transport system permease protein